MTAYWNSLKKSRKMDLQLILNKSSPWAHTNLEFNVVDIAKKLVKYVVYLFQKNRKINYSLHRVLKQQPTCFGT
jgi:hypothetical protein